jgi:uncharacterized protein with FMN-binding domain
VAATAAVGGLLAYADRAPGGIDGASAAAPAATPAGGRSPTSAVSPAPPSAGGRSPTSAGSSAGPPSDDGPAAAGPPSSGAPARPTTGTTAPSAAASNSTVAYADGTFTGPAKSTRFGPVQVRVTTSGGQITAVQALELPSGRRSTSINAQAAPVLESEALADQDAQLDIVTGATYTSEAYAASLQAALDQATPGTATGQG